MTTINQNKKQKEAKQNVEQWVSREFAEKPRVVNFDSSENKMLCRWISEQKVKKIHWRENRPYMLIEKWEFLPEEKKKDQFVSLNSKEQYGSLVVSGYLRGKAASANQLVHLVHYGTYQLENVLLLLVLLIDADLCRG